ncbi:hypothetical protein ACIRST_33835 [Kitasatospora sp. NPDC101447]|uniref:hypothetical protein n=1 Tax=Kitasatospora sp. NPDC101447 TaxID=3364102 RepID=UPI0038230169
MVMSSRHKGDPQRLALILPGLTYTPARPLLHYLARMLNTRGWSVRELWWDPPTRGRRTYVEEQALAALAEEEARQVLIVAKCLGSLFLPASQRHAIPGIWLTPMLDDPAVAEAVATGRTPGLVIGGTADPHWCPAAARAGRAAVLELPGADHGLEVPGEITTTLGYLGRVTAAAADFADSVPASRLSALADSEGVGICRSSSGQEGHVSQRRQSDVPLHDQTNDARS